MGSFGRLPLVEPTFADCESGEAGRNASGIPERRLTRDTLK